MKVTDTLQNNFTPYTLSIVVENAQDERVLAELYNHSDHLSKHISAYKNFSTSPENSRRPSEIEIYSTVRLMFASCFKKVYP